MVAAKILTPTMNPASPSLIACMTRNGVAAIAAISPMPWLMLFAISSPRDCSRWDTASDVLMPDTSRVTTAPKSMGCRSDFNPTLGYVGLKPGLRLVEILDPRQRKFRDVLTDRFDFLAVVAQLGIQALQHRMRMAVEQTLSDDAVHATAQFGLADFITDDLTNQLA